MILRKRIVTTLVTTAISAIIVAGAIGIPSFLSIQDLHGQINDAQAAIDERVAMFRYLRKTAADLETTQKRIAVLSQVAVHEGHELDFITATEGVAAATGVEQDLSLDTANPKTLSSWEQVSPVRLSVRGTYKQVRNYISMLERLPYLVNVRELSFNRVSGKDPNTTNVNAQLSATIYWIGANGPDFTRSVSN